MIKSQKGFGITTVIVALLILIGIGAAGWIVFNRQEAIQQKSTTQPDSTSQNASDLPLKTTESETKQTTTTSQPTIAAPTGLKVTAVSAGHKLTWTGSTSSSDIAKYLVYYQNKQLAEATSAEYTHNLPPPPPGCTPLSLKYFIKAVDTNGKASEPSESITVQYGGCDS